MNKVIAIVLFMSCFSAFTVAPVSAGGGLGGGATEPTQLMNNSELVAQFKKQVEMVTTQIKQLENMIQNTLQLPNQLMSGVGGITDSVQNIMNVYSEAQGLLHRLSNIDQELYSALFSAASDFNATTGRLESASKWKDYPKEYWNLSKNMDNRVKDTLKGLKIDITNLRDGGKLLERISRQAENADGANQIAMAGNQLLAFIGRQLHAAQQTTIDMSAFYTELEAERRAKEEAAVATLQDDIAKWQVPADTDFTLDWKPQGR